jgi:hypothetical protein
MPMQTKTAVQFRIRLSILFAGAISSPLGFGGRSIGIAASLMVRDLPRMIGLCFHPFDLHLTNDALGCT